MVKTSKATSVVPNTKYSNPKASYYEVAFENGDTGLMSIPSTQTPFKVGDLVPYTLEEVTSKTGEKINRITWPLGPQFAPPRVVENTPAQPAQSEKPYRAPDTDRKIVRQSCLKAAVDYYCHRGADVEKPGLAIRLLAQEFEEWVYRSAE